MDTLEKIVAEERAAEGETVLAPVAGGRKVYISIQSRFYECLLEKEFTGWGIFRLMGKGRVRLERDAEAWEIEKYAQAFSLWHLVLFHRDRDSIWWARDIKRDRFVPVHLVEGLQQFDSLRACHDGSRYWFINSSPSTDMRRARTLRSALSNETAPEHLPLRNLTLKEQELYAMALILKKGFTERNKDSFVRSVEKALHTGMGTLIECTEQNNQFNIRWRSGDGRSLSTMVDKNLSVISAGLCLSGGDRLQDLTSLASLVSTAPLTNDEEALYYH